MKRWIKVKDRLPKENQKVFYFFDVCGVFAGKYTLWDCSKDLKQPKGTTIYNCFYSDSGYLCDDVTHWMPRKDGEKLPLPPYERIKTHKSQQPQERTEKGG
jgi:hypothetical protein